MTSGQEDTRICCDCKVPKPVTSYPPCYGSGAKINPNRCYECFLIHRSIYFKDRYDTVHGRAVYMLQSARDRAKKRGLPMTIDIKWAEERLERGVCEATGLYFDFTADRKVEIARPLAPSIERKDPNKGYTPENCEMIVWILNRAKGNFDIRVFRQVMKIYLENSPITDDVSLVSENSAWNKSTPPSDKFLTTFNGETMTLFEWSKKLGISNNTLKARVKYGWPIEKVLSEKVREKKPKVTKEPKELSHYKCELCSYEWESAKIFVRCPKCRTRKWTNHPRLYSKALLSFNGETLSVAEWSRRLGLTNMTIPWRIKQGWPMEQVLSSKDRRFRESA